MRHSKEIREEAMRLLDLGYSDGGAASLLGLSRSTVRKWMYTYRALGEEALPVSKHRKYSQETKVAAARAVLEEKAAKPEVMATFGIRSITQIDTWCRLYREGGPDALLPKPKGRPRKKAREFSTREEELEARVRELELELEIQKRINALADEIERG